MSKPKIYLAGPITGLTYAGSTEWRQYVKTALPEIDCFSPLRAKDYLKHEEKIGDSYEKDQYVTAFKRITKAPVTSLSSQRGIYARDFNDCTTCDLLFVNLLGAEKVSIGTVMEISWAAMKRTPIVLIMEDEGNIHEHAMLREACAFRVNNLDDGIFLARTILLP